MVKIGSRDLSLDQNLNMAVGIVQVAQSAVCLIAPEKVGNCAVTTLSPTNKAMTRLGGTFAGAAGAHSIMSALDGGARNKDALKVNAAQCAVYAGTCLWDKKKNNDLKDERATVMAVLAGAAAIGLTYRATR